jgi:hypothetical protein
MLKCWFLTGFFLIWIQLCRIQGMGYYTVKNSSGFPVPAEMSLTKLSLDGNNEFIPLASVLDVSPYTKPAIL